VSVNTDSAASGGKASPQAPPRPVEKSRIFGWASSFYDWARKTRVHPGGGLRSTQTYAGTILSVIPMDAPIGSIQATFADIYGKIATDGREADLLRRVRDRGWVPCDGATYTVAEYRDLAYFLGVTLTDVTFTVPDMRGRMPMGWDNRGTPAAHSAAYDVQDVGGFRRHGQTENNHHDHEFAVSLTHTHTTALNSTDICTDMPVAGVCAVGSKVSVLVPSAADPETSGPEYDPTGDNVPSGEGSIARSGTGDAVVTVTLKHKGDDGDGSPDAPGEGAALDDVDNRPPYMVVNWIIKAL